MLFRSKSCPNGDCRLDAAGYASPAHQNYRAGVRQTLDKAGLGAEFTYHGVVDRGGKLAFLRNLDVLCVPATYDEPKGLFLIEAMACGVPVVQPRRGAFVEVVERTGGGLLVDHDSPAALAEGFRRLQGNPAEWAALSSRAASGAREFHSVSLSASQLVDVCTQVIAGAPAR